MLPGGGKGCCQLPGGWMEAQKQMHPAVLGARMAGDQTQRVDGGFTFPNSIQARGRQLAPVEGPF